MARGPAAAALAHDEAERLSRLAQREQALVQRERELTEQRRVLAEEYRLLRSQRARAVPAGIRVQVAPEPVAARFASGRHERLLTRLKRTLLGVSPPAVEEN